MPLEPGLHAFQSASTRWESNTNFGGNAPGHPVSPGIPLELSASSFSHNLVFDAGDAPGRYDFDLDASDADHVTITITPQPTTDRLKTRVATRVILKGVVIYEGKRHVWIGCYWTS